MYCNCAVFAGISIINRFCQSSISCGRQSIDFLRTVSRYWAFSPSDSAHRFHLPSEALSQHRRPQYQSTLIFLHRLWQMIGTRNAHLLVAMHDESYYAICFYYLINASNHRCAFSQNRIEYNLTAPFPKKNKITDNETMIYGEPIHIQRAAFGWIALRRCVDCAWEDRIGQWIEIRGICYTENSDWNSKLFLFLFVFRFVFLSEWMFGQRYFVFATPICVMYSPNAEHWTNSSCRYLFFAWIFKWTTETGAKRASFHFECLIQFISFGLTRTKFIHFGSSSLGVFWLSTLCVWLGIVYNGPVVCAE